MEIFIKRGKTISKVGMGMRGGALPIKKAQPIKTQPIKPPVKGRPAPKKGIKMRTPKVRMRKPVKKY